MNPNDDKCVCDGKEKSDLRSTTKGIVTLTGQFVEFWKNGLLPLDPAKITTNYVIGEDGTEQLILPQTLLN